MRKVMFLSSLLSVLAVGYGSQTVGAQAAPANGYGYGYDGDIVTFMSEDEARAYQQAGRTGQQAVKRQMNQNAAQGQGVKAVKVMKKINEANIKKMSIIELRLVKIRNKRVGTHEVTLKLKDGKVIAVMDDQGWKKARDLGNKRIASAKTGMVYSYTRGRLKRRVKLRYKSGQLTYKRCMKSRTCRKKYSRIAKKLKHSRYIPTRLRAKRCMRNRSCRSAVKRILRRYSKKTRYIPTKGRKAYRASKK